MKAHSAYFVATILGSVWLAGCSDKDGGSGGGAEAGAAGMEESVPGGSAGSAHQGSGGGGMAGSAMTGGAAGMAGSPVTGGAAGMAGSPSTTTFLVDIENVSDTGALPTPFAPGAYAVHSSGDPIFTDGSADRGDGLEALAEDGSPGGLVSAVTADPAVSQAGAFDTPVGGSGPGPVFPGEAFEFTVEAELGDMLSFASMFGQSNDVFAGTPAAGIPLFDSDGTPVGGDITGQLSLWDAGTERNEAPGMGPTQAPRQSGPNTGPAEGVVSERVDATRALPIPAAIVSVSVSESGGTYTVTLENISGSGPLLTPISPVFHAVHGDSYGAFTAGETASAGLESLAEDGDPSVLVTEAATAGADAESAGSSPIGPGESISFTATPTSTNSRLSLAAMVGQTNDAFIATPPDGISLLDESEDPRRAADVEAELGARLETWDAGTEANEAPGIGPNQAPRQAAPNTGPADPDSMVRLYTDSTNDVDAANLANLVDVTVTNSSGLTFDVTVSNTAGGTAFPLVLSPVAWAVHDDTVAAFVLGSPASAGLESLAEDGDSSTLLADVGALSGVSDSGSEGTGPIADGGAFSFQVTLSASNRFLSIWSMIGTSNDTFIALGPTGIELVDSSGDARSDADIASDVATLLTAYDAGTEANQAGGGGPDMAPLQAGPNTGASEGGGVVREVDDVWAYPQITSLLRVVVTPQ